MAVFTLLFLSGLALALPSPTSEASSCTVTTYSGVAAAVASCTAITLSNIDVPGGSTLDLSGLKSGTSVTFSGKTTFGYKAANYPMIKISGTNIKIQGASGHVIDGNGGAWWDGKGTNSGASPKPDFMFELSNVGGTSAISGLKVQNWPAHCFSIDGCSGLTVDGLTLDNSAGDAPNSKSGGQPAAHNTDGFDVSSSTNVKIQNTLVRNQDDCVAVSSGSGITVSGMDCVGGHGLSIGSVGGKSDNTVEQVVFENSNVTDSQNGCRIKTNSGTTGSVTGVTYSNIRLSGITDYGIDIEQDYLNSGPTGKPTNGVKIDGVTMDGVTGTMASGKDYYILCGDGSCSDFTFTNVDITGGSGNSCNYGFKC